MVSEQPNNPQPPAGTAAIGVSVGGVIIAASVLVASFYPERAQAIKDVGLALSGLCGCLGTILAVWVQRRMHAENKATIANVAVAAGVTGAALPEEKSG